MTNTNKAEFMIKLLTNKKEGGRLDKWTKHLMYKDSYYAIISGDISERFDDGSVITTSPAVKIHEWEGQKILETRHSYYYLGEQVTWREIEDQQRLNESEDGQ